MPVHPVPARPSRSRAAGGSVWEEAAGGGRAGGRIPVGGTTATAPDGGCVRAGDAEGPAVFVPDRIPAAILSAGGRAADVVCTRIHLPDAGDWRGASAVHALYFGDLLPADTLPGGVELIGPYRLKIAAKAVSGG